MSKEEHESPSSGMKWQAFRKSSVSNEKGKKEKKKQRKLEKSPESILTESQP